MARNQERKASANTVSLPDDRLPFPAFDPTKDLFQHPAFQPPANTSPHLHFFWYPSPLSRALWRFTVLRVTRTGRWFFVLTFALLFVGATTIEIQTYIPFLYAVSLWVIAAVAALLVKPWVALDISHTDRIRAGETLQVEVTLTQKGALPSLDLIVQPFRLPLRIDSIPPDGVAAGTLKKGETRRVRLGLYCPRRGVYPLWGYRVETDFPFGLMSAYQMFERPATLFVHPAYHRIRQMTLPTGRRFHPGGVALASRLGDSMEFLGNREFREGDSVRDIDWRATARMGGTPIVREYREEYFQRVGIVLDTYIPDNLKPKERAVRRAALERAVSLAAAVGEYMAAQEYLVDLFAAGPDLYHLTAGRSLAYLEQILDILACVEESPVEPMAVVAPQIQEHLEKITTVICIFLTWDETRRHFTENLRVGGAGVKVLLSVNVAAEVPTGLPDTTVVDQEMFLTGVETL